MSSSFERFTSCNKAEGNVTPENGTDPILLVEVCTKTLAGAVDQHVEKIVDESKKQKPDPVADVAPLGHVLQRSLGVGFIDLSLVAVFSRCLDVFLFLHVRCSLSFFLFLSPVF